MQIAGSLKISMYKRENIVRHRFILLMSTKWWIWYPLDLLISNIYQSPKYLWVKLTDVSNKISASYTPTPIFYLLLFYYFIINIILSLKRQPSCREEGRSFYHFFEVTTFPHCTFQHFEYFFFSIALLLLYGFGFIWNVISTKRLLDNIYKDNKVDHRAHNCTSTNISK